MQSNMTIGPNFKGNITVSVVKEITADGKPVLEKLTSHIAPEKDEFLVGVVNDLKPDLTKTEATRIFSLIGDMIAGKSLRLPDGKIVSSKNKPLPGYTKSVMISSNENPKVGDVSIQMNLGENALNLAG